MELCDIKGIGSKRAKTLNDLGIFTPADLLLRFPDKYIFARNKLTSSFSDGEEISFSGKVISEAKRAFIRKGLTIVTVVLENNGVKVKCSWFNQPFAARNLKSGDTVYCLGKVKKYGNSLSISNPTLLSPKEGDGEIVPVYKLGIPSRTFSSAVDAALSIVTPNSFIPTEIREKFGLISLQDAIISVHHPKTLDELNKARKTVSIENLSYVLSSYRLLKDDKRDFFYAQDFDVVNDFILSLPYELTTGQRQAVQKIIERLKSDKLMNLLLQGDVGCGKTVVALCCMYFAAKCGYQSAIMAPTEALARQHYATMIKLLEPLGIKCQLLCGSMNKVQKETALFNIRYGVVSCVAGTQSLISDDVGYNDLRLVIVDEQQRFGVNQRAKLEEKGKKTDIMVMTATPIPRTLALSLYGELQLCEIHTMPKGKAKIHTSVVPQNKVADMYKYIENKAKADERTYIICPRIENDDDANGVDKVYDMLKKTSLSSFLGCAHGKMKDDEKAAAIQNFRVGKTKVLIATTVVEVGIDVPEATTVVVYDAERFGLSELHQIRGRVGRGQKDSYCFLLTDSRDDEAKNRLKQFCAVGDGFSVSELDFSTRGAGDYVGLKQHGNTFTVDGEVIEKSKLIADCVVENVSARLTVKNSLANPEFIRSVTMN